MGVKMRERKPGEWWIFIAHKGRRKAVKVGTEKAAKAALPKIEEGLSTGKLKLNDLKEQVAFKRYAERWMDGHVKSNLKPATQKSYRFLLDAHILPSFGSCRIAEITREEVKKFCYAKIAAGLSAQSVRIVVIVLSSIFNHAKEDGLVDANPADKPGRFLKVPDRRGRVEFLTPEESTLLLDAAKSRFPRFHPLLLAALRTGMRQGELIGLQWGDIDWTGKFIEVRRSNWHGHISTPKNGRTRRIDMSDGLAEALALHRRVMAAEALKAGRPLPESVFTAKDGTQRDASNIRRCFESCLTRAGLRHVPFHALRHSFASHLLGNGESPAYVRAQMGHHSIQLTVDNYGHLIPGANREAVNRLDSLGELGNSATQVQPAAQENSQPS